MKNERLRYWADLHRHISEDELADYLEKKAEEAGANDMGRPDGMLAEAARRLRNNHPETKRRTALGKEK